MSLSPSVLLRLTIYLMLILVLMNQVPGMVDLRAIVLRGFEHIAFSFFFRHRECRYYKERFQRRRHLRSIISSGDGLSRATVNLYCSFGTENYPLGRSIFEL